MNVRRIILQPMLLGAVLALGFGVVWAVVSIWCIASVCLARQSERLCEEVVFLSDKTPLIYSYTTDNYWDKTCRTLQGKPVPMPPQREILNGTWMRLSDRSRSFFNLDWSRRIISFNDGSHPGVYWYFIHDGKLAGSGYFAAYDSKSRRLMGHIGLKGFRRARPPDDERFLMDGRKMGSLGMASTYDRFGWGAREPRYNPYDPGDDRFPRWVVYFISENRLMEVDLRERSVRVALELKEPLSLNFIERADRVAGPDETEERVRNTRWLAVREPDQVVVLGPGGKEQRKYPLPAEVRQETITFYELSDSTAIMHQKRSIGGMSRHTLLWTNQQGEVLRREEVETGQASWLDTPLAAADGISLAIPAPAVATPLVVFAMPLKYVYSGEVPDYPTALARTLSETWPAPLVLNMLGIALAWLVYRRQKRLGQRSVWAWTVFVFLFGVPGLVGYLFHRGWPVQMACPQCERPAPRDREECFACGEEFPEPPQKGTEVLV